MRLKNWFGTSILLAAFGLLGLPALAQQSQSGGSQSSDPVADAARKAREQQKTTPKPKHVFTDDDVRHSTDTGSATPTGGQAAGDAKAGDQKGQGAKGPGAAAGDKDQKEDPATVWRKRFADQRAKIASAEKELDILQREVDKAQLQYYPDPQKAMQEQNSRQDINDKNAKIDAKKQEIANLKQQLSDMEDQMRKSGGDPGWVR
jgi:hypothetical protein